MSKAKRRGKVEYKCAAINSEIDAQNWPESVTDYFKQCVLKRDRYAYFTYDKAKKQSDVICKACEHRWTVKERLKNAKITYEKAECSHSYGLVKSVEKRYLVCPGCKNELETVDANHMSHFYKHNIDCALYLQALQGAVVVRQIMYDRYYGKSTYSGVTEAQRTIFHFADKTVTDYMLKWKSFETHKDLALRSGGRYADSKPYYFQPVQSEEELRAVFSSVGLKNHYFPRIVTHEQHKSLQSIGDVTMLYKTTVWPSLESVLALGYYALFADIADGRQSEDKTLDLYSVRLNDVLGMPHKELVPFGHGDLTESL